MRERGSAAAAPARGATAFDARRLAGIVAVLALAHFALELTCGARLAARPPDAPTGLLLLYNACAFLTPVAIGLVADRTHRAAALAATGCLVVAVGATLPAGGLLGAIVLGLGNAAFHVAGGMTVLRMPRAATAVGIFVATGAIGLAAGTVIGATPGPAAARNAPMALACVAVAAAAAWSLRRPWSQQTPTSAAANATMRGWAAGGTPQVVAVVALVTLGLARTLVMTATPTPWKLGAPLVLAAACAAALGKAAGGALGDRFGLRRVAVIGTATATALVALAGSGVLPLGLLGIVAINLSVPLLLAMLAGHFPGHEGAIFGLGQAMQFVAVCAVGVSVPLVLLVAGAALCVVLALFGFAPASTKGRP